MVLRIEFRISWEVSFLAVSCTSSGGQMACWLVLITLARRVRGRVVLSPWLAEGVGRETRARQLRGPEKTSCDCTLSCSARTWRSAGSYFCDKLLLIYTLPVFPPHTSSCLSPSCGECHMCKQGIVMAISYCLVNIVRIWPDNSCCGEYGKNMA